VDQRVDDVLEHDPVGDPSTVTAERMLGMERRAISADRGVELDPDRLKQAGWNHRHLTPR
jgi:hypothetical protein